MNKTIKPLFFIIFVLILVQTIYANNLFLTAKYSKKQVCPYTTITFEFNIENTGSYTEIYTLSIDKKFQPWTTSSNDNIILKPGEKKTLYAYLTPDYSFYGTSELNFYIKTTYSKLKAKIPVIINVDNCYIPNIEPKTFLVNYTKTSNNLNIINTGSKTASYLLILDAPSWVEIEPTSVVVEPGKSKSIKLTTTPTENIRKGTYIISLITVVKENNAQYQHTFNIKLTAPGFCSKLFSAFKANIAKFLLYSGLIFLLIIIILIIILSSKKIKKPKKPLEKVEKKVIAKIEKPKIKEKPKPLPKKTKKRITIISILLLLAILIEINLFAFRHKLTFEIPTVKIPEAIPKVAKVEPSYYDNIKNIGLTILDFVKTYYLYLIIGAVILAVVIVLLFLIIKKILKIKRIKEKKVEIKPKVKKEVKIKIPIKTIITLIIIIAILAALTLAVISLWNYIKLYWPYLIIAFVLLAIIIFVLILRQKKIKVKRKPKEKVVKEKKVIAKVKKPKKPKIKKKVKTKTLKSLLIVAIIFVLLMASALYVTLNYEEIAIKKPGKNFVEIFFDKTKQLIKTPPINITKFFKKEEIPGVVFEKGIPPQKWAINTVHTLDLLKYFSDPDNDPLTYSSTQPENIAVEIENSIATFSPEYNWTGVNTVVFTADDGKGGIIRSNNVYLAVQEEIKEPTININEIKNKVVNFFVSVKDYIIFYLNYIITGFVILIILILIITYNKRLLKFLEEEPKKRKRKK